METDEQITEANATPAPIDVLETAVPNVEPTNTAAAARAAYEASHSKRVPKPKTRMCVCGCGAEIPAAREFAPGHLKALHSRVKVMVVQFRTFQTPIDLGDMALAYATKRGWLE